MGLGRTRRGQAAGPSLGRDRRGGPGKGQKGPVTSKQPLSLLLLLRTGEAPIPEVAEHGRVSEGNAVGSAGQLRRGGRTQEIQSVGLWWGHFQVPQVSEPQFSQR